MFNVRAPWPFKYGGTINEQIRNTCSFFFFPQVLIKTRVDLTLWSTGRNDGLDIIICTHSCVKVLARLHIIYVRIIYNNKYINSSIIHHDIKS